MVIGTLGRRAFAGAGWYNEAPNPSALERRSTLSLIEVFADVCCPFTHVGLRRMVARRKVLSAEYETAGLSLYVRAWPLELVNGAPLDADFIAEEVVALREQVAPDLFAGFDKSAFPATALPALSLAADAYGCSIDVGERVSLALRDELFEHGHDIADLQVLAAIADAHGVRISDDRRSIKADWDEGRARGVVGSPHFFAPGIDAFCPVLDITRVDGHLRIAADPDALESFLQHCLAP